MNLSSTCYFLSCVKRSFVRDGEQREYWLINLSVDSGDIFSFYTTDPVVVSSCEDHTMGDKVDVEFRAYRRDNAWQLVIDTII